MGLGHISTSYGLNSGLLGATSSQEFLLYYSSYLWSLCRIYRTVQESVLPPLQALRLKESPCLFFAVKFCTRRTWRRALWLLYSSASAYASDNLVFTRSYKRKRKRSDSCDSDSVALTTTLMTPLFAFESTWEMSISRCLLSHVGFHRSNEAESCSILENFRWLLSFSFEMVFGCCSRTYAIYFSPLFLFFIHYQFWICRKIMNQITTGTQLKKCLKKIHVRTFFPEIEAITSNALVCFLLRTC